MSYFLSALAGPIAEVIKRRGFSCATRDNSRSCEDTLGRSVEVLTVRIHSAALTTVITTNEQLIMRDDIPLPKHALVAEHHLSLDTAMDMVSIPQNFSGRTIRL